MKAIKIITLVASFAASFVFADNIAAIKAASCNLDKFAQDPIITKNFTIGKDPVGLAIQAKSKSVDARAVLANYAKTNRCDLHTVSLFDLVNGLFKGSNLDLNGMSGDNSAMGNNMTEDKQEFIVLGGTTVACARELDLQLPIKTNAGK